MILEDQIRAIAERVAASESLEVVDVEVLGRGKGSVVRIFLDKPGGVTHDDCETVSRQVGTILDIEDVVPNSYTLEVSSPGLDRKLKTLRDFERFAGQQVKLLLRTDQSPSRAVRGRLAGVENGRVQVHLEGGGFVAFSTGEIERANLVPDFGGKFAPRRRRPH